MYLSEMSGMHKTPAKNNQLDRAKDTGMAFVLICLIGWLVTRRPPFVLAAVVLLVADMTWPALFVLPSKAWFGLSTLIGTVVSKVLISLVFFLLVTPVGLVRRLFGVDRLRLKQFRKGSASVFLAPDHTVTPQDIKYPF